MTIREFLSAKYKSFNNIPLVDRCSDKFLLLFYVAWQYGINKLLDDPNLFLFSLIIQVGRKE